ncbi:MAG: M50 family metallopeptidase [Clostridia bacterium]|nr:M50 family metallopeptidase [Clostridia bacterium]
MTFKVKGSRVSISFFFFFTVCIALVLDTTNTAVLTLFAAVIHESGHLFCMLACGEKPSKVFLAPFGMCITRFSGCNHRREMCIALAGPVANLFAAAVMAAVMCICDLHGLFKPVAVNVSLAVFNLLPIEPLDCGRAIKCRLMCRMNSAKAEKTVFIIGIICLIPLSAFGFYVLIRSRYNITLLLASIYLSFTLLKRRE